MFWFKLITSSLVIVSLTLIVPIPYGTLHPDVGLTILQMMPRYGYPLETHFVETPDGYILQLHRIPHGIQGNDMRKKTPVLLMHGLLSSSVDWVVLGPGKSLGYLLADKGYDVWLGNSRGNTYSRNHSKINPDSNPQQFFNYSIHELGVLDLPTTIDYILEVTESKNLSYVGHSQGCASFFIMTSERPEYNAKIRSMYALAPAVFMANTKGLGFRLPADFSRLTNFALRSFGMNNELLPRMKGFGIYVCADYKYRHICPFLLDFVTGSNPSQMNNSILPVFFSNFPAGAATKQLIHYTQNVRSGNFAQFDHGPFGNMEKYGQETPPSYDFDKVTTPVTLIYTRGDSISSDIDVEKLARKLPNLVEAKLIPEFDHMNFLIANDIVDLLNGGIVAELDKLNV